MVHCRSTGCVGVDVRKKVTFKVLPAIFVKRPATAATAKAPAEEQLGNLGGGSSGSASGRLKMKGTEKKRDL